MDTNTNTAAITSQIEAITVDLASRIEQLLRASHCSNGEGLVALMMTTADLLDQILMKQQQCPETVRLFRQALNEFGGYIVLSLIKTSTEFVTPASSKIN